MKIIYSLITLLIFSASVSLAQRNIDTSNPQIETLRQRLFDNAIEDQGFIPSTSRYLPIDLSQAGVYLNSMTPTGQWEDVDYGDQDNFWNPLVALDRMLVMCYAYQKQTDSLYQNPELLAGIVKALDYWYEVNPRCKNWYKNEIAKQFYFNVIGILLQDHIDQSLLNKIIQNLTEMPRKTGSNKTLLSISVFYRGVLEKNEARIQAGIIGVKDQIRQGTGEGIQVDYSFHQHGPFIYNGSYGHNFLRETMWFAAILQGTEYAYSEKEMDILRTYYQEGTRWMIRGELLDYNVRGRQVGRSTGGFTLIAKKVIPQLNHFILADPANRAFYEDSKKRIQQQQPQEVMGNRHYWRSDYTVHHRKAYFTSLKMCSQRTIGMEMDVNSENMYGYYLPYGLTYIYRKGDEYLDIFPTWDWARLPGVTSPHLEIKQKGKSTQQTTFVGGVSDGTYGLSAMDLDIQQTQAKKSWFWFDREWVALGAGIQSTHKSPIVTGINQTLRKGAVVQNGVPFAGGEVQLPDASWIWHDSVAYLFPNAESVMLKVGEQSGHLQKIYGLGADSVYRSDVFSLWFDHGKQPENASYAYIVVPGIGESDTDTYSHALPIHILQNTSKIQAVYHQALAMTGIAFHEAGEFTLPNQHTIWVDQPCLLWINHGTHTLSLSDPTATLKFIQFRISLPTGKGKTQTLLLPENAFAGKSVQVDMD